MGDQHRLTDDERRAIGRDAGVPWLRVRPGCGHQPAAVGTADDGETDDTVDEDGHLVLSNPWLGCPACGEEWQAHGVRYVLAEVPPLDSPEMEQFCRDFVAALEAGGSAGPPRPGRRRR